MPTIEEEVGLLSTAATALTTAVNISKSNTDAAIATFAETTNTVVNSLNLVDNTADIDKPVSTLQASAIAGRQATLVDGTNISTVNGMSLLDGSPLVIERAPTEIAAETYDNRADLKTIVGSLAGDSVVVEGIGLLQFVETEEEPEDDETCFTVPGVGQWLLAAPAVDLIAAHNIFEVNIVYEAQEDSLKNLITSLTALGVI
jgi:hypothetical protein